jgi:hypothetical protein
MTTQELFTAEKVTLEMLGERMDESSYWEGCHKFISQKWNDELEGMTQKQANWADKILEDMIEWRIKNQ